MFTRSVHSPDKPKTAKRSGLSLRNRPDVWIPTFLALALIVFIAAHGKPRGLSEPLQKAAAATATEMLQAVGAPSRLNGTRIITGHTYNHVTEECSGLEIMIAMALLTFTFGRLLGVSPTRTVIASVMMVALAFVMNSLRIASISLVAWRSGVEVAWGAWHDASAYIAFGFAYGLMFLTLLRLRTRSRTGNGRQKAATTMAKAPPLPND